ncbi:MAG: bifunctional proline dehydrogenase/L-glutamate gamma-semialdehyde dehydrogenase PutA, partial [Pseudomonadota bacterium]
DVIEAVLRDPRLAGWDGFGVVVQAYGKRAPHVIRWLHQLAEELDRKIMVRLVKGAYWDAEIKRAQVEGLTNFPVFTHKAATDVSYLCCAQMLLSMTQRIFPQFATHNAHTVSAVLELAEDTSTFEFQRLHGMGEALHQAVLEKENTQCRIYAPVGAHEDLLAYLVRRLLENGANSSFVNQIVDTSLPAETVAADPFEAAENITSFQSDIIRLPAELYGAERTNSRGWDLHNEDDLEEIDAARVSFKNQRWTAEPLLAVPFEGTPATDLSNPADPSDQIGQLIRANEADTEAAIAAARAWSDTPASDRAAVLTRASELYEENFGELFAALAREAGKTPLDAVAELREAVDFLRYYGAQAALLPEERTARGIIACISPWNFPLAIFTGQIAAALAAGNAVLAKPADPTPVIATIAVKLMHKAGVPKEVLQLLPGRGSVVGAKLTSSPRINGFCFTGSTATAMTVNRSMAEHLQPQAPLIAETGGLNAMIVDSTALPEQAVRDIIASAFQSAGQRCSALRILFLQEDIAESFEQMLFGAMDELTLGDPWAYTTDVGPVITQSARVEIEDHIDQAAKEGRLLKRLSTPSQGTFVGPAVLRVNGMEDMQREIFGPVLHIATFKAHEVDDIVADINHSGYGLTFGLHTRIDDRVEQITSALNVGNMYINRNQIGAIVGSQPFGGEGLSGTGPKAGGPRYVRRFTTEENSWTEGLTGKTANPAAVQSAIDALNQGARKTITTLDLPGPTGESNRWSLHPRGVVLCLGPSLVAARKQLDAVKACGGIGLIVAEGADRESELPGILDEAALVDLQNIAAVILWSTPDHLAAVRQALARREGPLIPLVCETAVRDYCLLERHICIDTTAAGGNASLLAASSEPSFADAPLRQSA